MKKNFSHTQVFTLLTILLWGTACNGQIKKDSPTEKVSESSILSVGHPKLIKNLGSLKDKGHNVNASLQDKSGNLWFGTTGDGVYKYDGKSFTQFTTSNGMNSNTVWCILEDKSGKIWIGTDDGVCLYDGHKFSKIQIALPNDTLSSKYDVWSMMQDKSGKLWFATTIGIYVYDGKSFNYFKVTDDVKDCYANLEKILEDNAGNFWFGGRCHDGVYRYDGKSVTKFELKKLYEDSPLRERNWAFPQLQDKNGNIWFSNWDGVYRYDGKSFTTFTKKDGLSGNMVCRIKEDKKGNIWFGGAGLSRYDGTSFTRFTTKDGLLNESVWSILEDKTGAIWVGTRETILHRFDGKTFTSYTENDEQETETIEIGKVVSELDNQIWRIFQDSKGKYWFGSNGRGIYYLDGNELKLFTTTDGLVNNTIRGIQEDSGGNIYIETPEGISKFNGKNFATLKGVKSPYNKWKLNPNDLWFGYNANDLYRYDGDSLFQLKLPRKDLKKAFGVDTLSIYSGGDNPYAVYSVNKDKDGNIWFGTFVAGAFRYDGKSFLWFDEKELSILPDATAPGVRSIVQDKDGYFWLSNFISKYKIESDKSAYIKLKGIEKDKPNYFNSGIVGKDGNLWMTSYGGSVWKYDGKTLSSFKINNGKENVLLISIYQDKNCILWLGTDNDGVYKQNGDRFEKFKLKK